MASVHGRYVQLLVYMYRFILEYMSVSRAQYLKLHKIASRASYWKFTLGMAWNPRARQARGTYPFFLHNIGPAGSVFAAECILAKCFLHSDNEKSFKLVRKSTKLKLTIASILLPRQKRNE